MYYVFSLMMVLTGAIAGQVRGTARRLDDESGQGFVEYGLILAGIAILVIGAIFLLGPLVAGVFDDVVSEIEGAD